MLYRFISCLILTLFLTISSSAPRVETQAVSDDKSTLALTYMVMQEVI